MSARDRLREQFIEIIEKQFINLDVCLEEESEFFFMNRQYINKNRDCSLFL